MLDDYPSNPHPILLHPYCTPLQDSVKANKAVLPPTHTPTHPPLPPLSQHAEYRLLPTPSRAPLLPPQDSVKGYKAVSRTLAREYNTHALAVLQGSGIQLSTDGASAAASVAAGGVAGSSTAAAKAAAAAGVAGADASEEEVQRLYKDMGELTCIVRLHRP
jgi:hypothetical protein